MNGPFLVRMAKGRGQHSHKAYLVLFVCLATRAIHLELANDYTTSGFLGAYHRFTSRRGTLGDIYSDNGLNFRGADRELRSALATVRHAPEIQNQLAVAGTTWHFIPPHAPHFGGIWEAGVKSAKFHLKRVLGTHTLTFEELSTWLARVEACLNSRPLGSLSTDPDDLAPLTPGHFLIGVAINSPPETSVLQLNENRLSRWQLVQRLTEQFWRRWSVEYLRQMQ